MIRCCLRPFHRITVPCYECSRRENIRNMGRWYDKKRDANLIPPYDTPLAAWRQDRGLPSDARRQEWEPYPGRRLRYLTASLKAGRGRSLFFLLWGSISSFASPLVRNWSGPFACVPVGAHMLTFGAFHVEPTYATSRNALVHRGDAAPANTGFLPTSGTALVGSPAFGLSLVLVLCSETWRVHILPSTKPPPLQPPLNDDELSLLEGFETESPKPCSLDDPPRARIAQWYLFLLWCYLGLRVRVREVF
jgi:hypothetical protein